jgi:hypothetical protein
MGDWLMRRAYRTDAPLGRYDRSVTVEDGPAHGARLLVYE